LSVRQGPRLPLEELAPFLIDTLEKPTLLDWKTIFHNHHPVEIEVGFGKGLFLINAGLAYPDVNFLGIEIVRKYQLFTANRIAKRRLVNVRLACADARLFLRDFVRAASVQSIHVFFPDPWWKNRHRKRRVFTPEFVTQCERVLCPGGRLNVLTDVGDYFAVITALIQQHTQLQMAPVPELPEPAHDLDYLTNFERKFRKEGRQIHRGIFERTIMPRH
jgi:tRNA (guanine-N7-)-methyltransferase